MTKTNAIDVVNLTKSYGEKKVLHDVTFSVERGKTFALVGANGSGKTTILEIIEGLRSYQAGAVTIFSENITKRTSKRLRERIGVQLQSSSLPEQMTVVEIMKLVCAEGRLDTRFDLLEKFGLTKSLKERYANLSEGQKRRLHLSLALVRDPELLILDEPTAGLDIQGRNELHDKIRQLQSKGITILLSSHDVAEIESLCNSIGILKDGVIECFESVEAFQNNQRASGDTKSDTVLCFRVSANNQVVDDVLNQSSYRQIESPRVLRRLDSLSPMLPA